MKYESILIKTLSTTIMVHYPLVLKKIQLWYTHTKCTKTGVFMSIYFNTNCCTGFQFITKFLSTYTYPILQIIGENGTT